MNYIIRKATKQDFPVINSLFAEMMFSIYGQTDASYKEENMGHYFSATEDQILVAEDNNGILGFLSMEAHRKEDEAFLYFDDISVTASCRGKGIGSALFDAGESYAAELGLGILVLHVEEHNVHARRLYQRRGFTKAGSVGSRHRMMKRL